MNVFNWDTESNKIIMNYNLVNHYNCPLKKTTRTKFWDCKEEYSGETDKLNRKVGLGENYWRSAEYMQSYIGEFYRDTMHGLGDYRWRYDGPDCGFETYEGNFYVNRLHGYGTVSYQDGRVFTGLFKNGHRCGPGVDTLLKESQDVGIWCGSQLIRLSWRPNNVCVPNFFSTIPGRTALSEYRTCLKSNRNNIKTKEAPSIENLIIDGVDISESIDDPNMLLANHCTDLNSLLFNRFVFDKTYYKGNISTLSEISDDDLSNISENDDVQIYYAWNNNLTAIEIMKHCFKHEGQRNDFRLNISSILSGLRTEFNRPGNRELNARTLLMACYVGNMYRVTKLINEKEIYIDVADSSGNTPLMYAVCSDQADVIYFLLGAGADPNINNDSCCTALSIALMKYCGFYFDIPLHKIITTILPATVPVQDLRNSINEWHLQRIETTNIPRMASKQGGKSNQFKSNTSFKKSNLSMKEVSTTNKLNTFQDNPIESDRDKNTKMQLDYDEKIIADRAEIKEASTVEYIFNLIDLCTEIINYKSEQLLAEGPTSKGGKKTKDSKPVSKLVSEINMEVNFSKEARLEAAKKTVLQLLEYGADPKLVRFPQSALCLAIQSNSADIVRALIDRGVDVNETYPKLLGYHPIELALCQKLTAETLGIVKELLHNGADVSKRIYLNAEGEDHHDGPTLLHAMVTKNVNNEVEEEIRNSIITLLLKFGCDATAFFEGRSPISIAMSCSPDRLSPFMYDPNTDLNAVINDENQTILMKMFTHPFSSIYAFEYSKLSSLISYGADPLLKCEYLEFKYANLFELSRYHGYIEGSPALEQVETKDKSGKTGDAKLAEMKEYGQRIDFLADLVRQLRVRWMESKYMRELIGVIHKFKHRAWHLIMKEYHNKKAIQIWLKPERCLEIWQLLQITKNPVYQDKKILRHLLCIVKHYNVMQYLGEKLTFEEKETIEEYVASLLKVKSPYEMSFTKLVDNDNVRSHVIPELFSTKLKKFNVCFECSLPLPKTMVPCDYCGQISFCNYDCLYRNIAKGREDHPCTPYLKEHYQQELLECSSYMYNSSSTSKSQQF